MQNQTRAEAWDELLRSALARFVIPFAVYAGLLWIVAQTSGRTMMESFLWTPRFLMPLVVVHIVVSWIRFRRIAGPVLLDCGPTLLRTFHGVMAVVMISFCFLGPDSGSEIPDWFALWIPFATLSGLMAFGRIQMREQGLWHSLVLVKWEKVHDYRWEGAELTFRAETFFSKVFRPARTRIQIPDEYREGVDEILKRRVA